MKTFGILIFLAMLAAGCIWDNASVAPRTMIRMHRTGENSTAMASTGQFTGTNSPTNMLTNDTAALGVAPYLSQVSNTATLSETNSLTGVNSPRITTSTGVVGTSAGPGAVIGPGAPGSPSGVGVVPTAPTLGTTPRTAGSVPGTGTGITGTNPTGIGSTPTLNPATGGSIGTGLGGTTTGSAIGLPSNTINGLTNNFLGTTNLFGPRP